MALNLDTAVSNAQSILRGEAPGALRLLVLGLITLTVWTGEFLLKDSIAGEERARSSQESRFHTLLMLGNEYKALAPSSRSRTGNVDVATVFAQVSERMELGSRVNRVTPDGRNQTVEINRLYAEELTRLQEQLASRGVRFIAAELRALPSGSERLFTVSAIIGPVN